VLPFRLNVERFYDAEPGLSVSPSRGAVAFVGASPSSIRSFSASLATRSALLVDPHHRLLLETAWEALETRALVASIFEKGTILGVGRHFHNDLPVIQGIALGLPGHFASRFGPPARAHASPPTASPTA